MKNINTYKAFSFLNKDAQLEVLSSNVSSKFKLQKSPIVNNPLNLSEFILSGIIAFVETIALEISQKENFILKSLQVEVVAEQNISAVDFQIDNFFKSINIQLYPVTDADFSVLEIWLQQIVAAVNIPTSILNIEISEKFVLKNIA